MAKCPKCGAEISSSDKACPKCGAAVGNKQILKTVSNAVMAVGGVLVILDLFGVIQTYIGTLLIGIGFLIHAVFQRDVARETGEKKALIFSIVFGVIITIAGVAYLILDIIRA